MSEVGHLSKCEPDGFVCSLHSLTAFHFPFVPHYSLFHYSITSSLHSFTPPLHHPLWVDIDNHLHILVLPKRRGLVVFSCSEQHSA